MLAAMLRFFLALVVMLNATSSFAEISIYTQDTSAAKKFANVIANQLKDHSVKINPKKENPSDVVVAVGNTALVNLASKATITIGSYISYDTYDSLPDNQKPKIVIFSDPDPSSLVQAINSNFPKKKIGYILGSGKEPYLSLLQEAGLKTITYNIDDEGIFKTLSNAYRDDVTKVFLISENREVFNKNTILYVLESLYRNRIPAISMNKALIKKGSTLTVYTNPENVANKTVEEIKAALINDKREARIFPDSEITMDYELAEKLSITVGNR